MYWMMTVRQESLLVNTVLHCISLLCTLTPSTESTFVVCLQKTVCALHIAARIGHAELVCYLLDDGGTAGSVKGSTSGSEVSSQILTDDTGETALHLAASAGHIEVIRELVWRGLPVNKPSLKGGNTPLSLAIERGHLDAVQELLKRGADPNLPAQEPPVTPLQLASRLGKELVEMLLKFKARVNDGVGKSPLHEAILARNRETAESLLEAGADIRWTVDICQTPLQLVESAPDFKELLERYADRQPAVGESQKRLSGGGLYKSSMEKLKGSNDPLLPIKTPERVLSPEKERVMSPENVMSPDKPRSDVASSNSSLQQSSHGGSSSNLAGRIPLDSNSSLHNRISSMGSGTNLALHRAKSGSHGNLTLTRSPRRSQIPLDSNSALFSKFKPIPRSPSAGAIDKPRYNLPKAERRNSFDALGTPPPPKEYLQLNPLTKENLRKHDSYDGGQRLSRTSLSSDKRLSGGSDNIKRLSGGSRSGSQEHFILRDVSPKHKKGKGQQVQVQGQVPLCPRHAAQVQPCQGHPQNCPVHSHPQGQGQPQGQIHLGQAQPDEMIYVQIGQHGQLQKVQPQSKVLTTFAPENQPQGQPQGQLQGQAQGQAQGQPRQSPSQGELNYIQIQHGPAQQGRPQVIIQSQGQQQEVQSGQGQPRQDQSPQRQGQPQQVQGQVMQVQGHPQQVQPGQGQPRQDRSPQRQTQPQGHPNQVPGQVQMQPGQGQPKQSHAGQVQMQPGQGQAKQGHLQQVQGQPRQGQSPQRQGQPGQVQMQPGQGQPKQGHPQVQGHPKQGHPQQMQQGQLKQGHPQVQGQPRGHPQQVQGQPQPKQGQNPQRQPGQPGPGHPQGTPQKGQSPQKGHPQGHPPGSSPQRKGQTQQGQQGQKQKDDKNCCIS